MTFLILWCISETSFSIKSEYLKFFVFSMRISEDDEKWVWNIIFILFCAVIMMLKHFDLIRRRIVTWVSVSAIAFLAHFVVLNSFLENCSTFCMIFQYSLRFCFLMILLFLSHAWMYSVQLLMIQQLLLIYHMLLMIFIHFFVHFALIISCDFAQRVKISIIFFSVFIYASTFCLMIWQWFSHLFSQNIDEFLFIYCLSVATRFSRWLFADSEIYNCLYQQMI